MAGTEDIKKYIIGVLLFSAIIVGGVSFMATLNARDASFMDGDRLGDFNETFGVLNDVSTQVTELESGITNADADPGLFGVLNSLIMSAWQSLKLTVNSFNFMDDVFTGLGPIFGIPVWIAGIITLIISVVIIFAIWSAIFQR